ncbi:MAG: HDOD domain-containing protein [Pseudomonadota bacterium]
MTSLEQEFREELFDAIENDRLTLPTLPEVALKVRETVNDPNVSAATLAQVISEDAALAARIIKVANSPLLRGRVAVDNLQLAVSRLGLTFVRNLATGLAMEQMFHANSPVIEDRLRESWEHSKEVASICHVLTLHYTNLKADQSLLAGLVHEIGILPILTLAEEYDDLMENKAAIDSIVASLHPSVGTKILQAWDFPLELLEVPAGYLDFERDSGSHTPDYVDVVTVANVQSYAGTDHPLANVAEQHIVAFEKLGLSTEVDVHEVEELAEELTEAKLLLG